MSLCTGDFDYPLPPELVAQQPLERRDRSRLMVLRRAGGVVEHHVFAELPALLRSGDVLVINDTRVVPARFFARRATGGAIEGLFLGEAEPGRWEAMLKNAGKCSPGERLGIEGAPDAHLVLQANLGGGRWTMQLDPPQPAGDILEKVGAAPLPPYIRRERRVDQADRKRYQTVYAARAGAVAAPTAGLHFTESLLGELASAGIQTVNVTLHVGLGTFAPVKADRLEEHQMHTERYELSAPAAKALNAARAEGRRIVAVGTTSVRVLETTADAEGRFVPAVGQTDIFIRPPHEFRAVDAMITNFHLPRSTLLMLVAAFCGPGSCQGVKMILDAYAKAVAAGYRFYSYGDAMLIE